MSRLLGITAAAFLVAAMPTWAGACDRDDRSRRDREAIEAGSPEARALYERAQAAEKRGANAEAVDLYKQAGRRGSDFARMRLGEIYDKGQLGESKDFAESVKWWSRNVRTAC